MRNQIADFVAALVGVYTLIIFASIIVSWLFSFGVRVPYSRPLNAVFDFLRDVTKSAISLRTVSLPPRRPLPRPGPCGPRRARVPPAHAPSTRRAR